MKFIYNTRASRPLEKFLIDLKRVWCSVSPMIQSVPSEGYGDELDIKFRNSLHFELDEGEIGVVQYFDAPVPATRKILLFRRLDWRPGNLVLLTSMNRLVWITDQYRDRRELYASISFSVPASSIRNARVEETGGRRYLAISFRAGNSWRFPVDRCDEETSSFLWSLNSL